MTYTPFLPKFSTIVDYCLNSYIAFVNKSFDKAFGIKTPEKIEIVEAEIVEKKSVKTSLLTEAVRQPQKITIQQSTEEEIKENLQEEIESTYYEMYNVAYQHDYIIDFAYDIELEGLEPDSLNLKELKTVWLDMKKYFPELVDEHQITLGKTAPYKRKGKTFFRLGKQDYITALCELNDALNQKIDEA